MSTVVAVLISVILVIIAWQVGVRNAWGKLAKIVAVLFATILLLAALGFGWIKYDEFQRAREEERRALEHKLDIQKNGAKQLNGVSVGMEEREVIYLLGRSKEIDKPTESDSSSGWSYDSAGLRIFIVFLNGKVLRVAVLKKDEYVNFSEHGVAFGDSESTVRAVLGEPTEPQVLDENGYKILLYGPKDRRFTLSLLRGAVVGMRVGDGTKALPKGYEQFF
jgi:hypothetical protein